MTKDCVLADTFTTESSRNRIRSKLVHNVVEHVDLRIGDVNINEIEELSTLVYALQGSKYEENVIENGDGKQDFVVRVKPARLNEVKEALHVILTIVNGERIAIDT